MDRRSIGGIAVDLVNVHAMEGDGTAVKVNLYHHIDPSAKVPSVCYIDGDSQQTESAKDRVFRLPGTIPESFIYSEVVDALSDYSGILAVSLHKRYEDADGISTKIREIKIANRDPHILYSQVGRALGLIPEEIIIGGFLNVWCTAYPEKVKKLLEPIMDLLPKEEKPKMAA
jgi:hypothetical protein